MALSPMQNSSQGFASHILESMPVVKYGKWRQEKLREVDLEINVLKQRSSTTESLATLGNGGDEHLHAATESESRHDLAGAADVPGATAEVFNTQDERMRSESRDQPLNCSVCTEDFGGSDDVRVLPCSHIYHRFCIDPWLLDFGATCPLCRVDLRIVTISSPPTLVTANYDLPSPFAETEVVTEVARAFRLLARSLDSHLVSTAGSEVGITTIHRIQSEGQGELSEMTGIVRARWRKGSLWTTVGTAVGTAVGLRKLN